MSGEELAQRPSLETEPLRVVPEADGAPEQQSPSRLKRIGRWAIAGAVAAGASLGMLQLMRPSAEERIGPVRIEMSANGEGGFNALGEKLDSPVGLVGVDIDIQAPYPKEIDSVIEDVSEISHTLKTTDKELVDIIYEQNEDKIRDAALLMTLKAGLLVALTGGAVFTTLNEYLKRYNHESSRPFRTFAAGMAGAAALFGANIALAYQTFDKEQAAQEADQKAIKPHLTDFFTDKTTKEVIGYRKISEEISRNLLRLDRYGEALSLSRTLDEDLVYVLVDSDRHMRAPHPELEAIIRASGAQALVSLGDFVNRGTEFESELMGGPEIFGTDFEGIQDIRECERWDPADPLTCAQEGGTVPQFHVLGNHDPAALNRVLQDLDSQDINQRVFWLPGIDAYFAGASDGCFLPDADCHSSKGDKEANRRAGQQLREVLENNGLRPAAVFVSHPESAKALDGYVPYIFAGEEHEARLEKLPGGSTLVVVGTSGQAFGREADEASATLAGLDPRTGEVKDLLKVSWQGLEPRVPPQVIPYENLR